MVAKTISACVGRKIGVRRKEQKEKSSTLLKTCTPLCKNLYRIKVSPLVRAGLRKTIFTCLQFQNEKGV